MQFLTIWLKAFFIEEHWYVEQNYKGCVYKENQTFFRFINNEYIHKEHVSYSAFNKNKIQSLYDIILHLLEKF